MKYEEANRCLSHWVNLHVTDKRVEVIAEGEETCRKGRGKQWRGGWHSRKMCREDGRLRKLWRESGRSGGRVGVRGSWKQWRYGGRREKSWRESGHRGKLLRQDGPTRKQ